MLKQQDIRAALEDLVADDIATLSRRYRHESAGLSIQGHWKPVVLIIGNYSSGKSTLINELVGGAIQRTGQAPTDDCFTVLVGDDSEGPVEVVEEMTGQTMVNDPTMPFAEFKKFGSRFISHFVMKKVRSPRLRDLAVIDSPGMLDSVTELDRGYDYQQVIGRLAELADLVVLVFDPHRAGTIKETYVSIRSTLPAATSEDRVLFVMNRIDECKNLSDLLRCYGVLCWNLSQMTGRKDVPRVFLTYSPTLSVGEPPFQELALEREELIDKIEQAPRLQVSHLLGTVDNHLHRLELMARTLANATAHYRRRAAAYWQMSALSCVAAAIALDALLAWMVGEFGKSSIGRLFSGHFLDWALAIPIGAIIVGMAVSYQIFRRYWQPEEKARLRAELDRHAPLDDRYARDLWEAVKGDVETLLDDPKEYRWLANHRLNASRLRRLIDNQMKSLYEQHLGVSPAMSSEGRSSAEPSSPTAPR